MLNKHDESKYLLLKGIKWRSLLTISGYPEMIPLPE